MREIGLIAKYEYWRHLRRKSFLWVAIGLPLLMLVGFQIIVLIVTTPPDEQQIGLVDMSGRFAQTDLTRDRFGREVAVPLLRFADEAAARAALTAEQIDGVAIVPADYLATGKVKLIAPRSMSDKARDSIEDVLRQGLITSLPAEQRGQFGDPTTLTLRTLGTNREISAENFLLFLLPYVLAILFIMTAFTTSGFLLQALADEKEDRVMEILATSLRPSQMMAGKILGLSTLGLTQIGAWMAWVGVGLAFYAPFRALVSDLQLPWGVLVLSALFFLLGYLLVAALYAAIGASVTNPQEAQQFAAPVSLMIVTPLWLLFAILAQPNSTLAVILSLIPVTAPITMLLRLPIANIPFWQIALSLLLLLASAIGMMLLAARLMRIGMLRYGKRLTLREMFSRSGGAS